jgi:DNA-binding response OmpR family regulator
MRVLLNLTPNESTMLRALYEAHGRTLSYEFLIETRIRVNAEDPANSRRAVSVLIHRLRKKLGMDIIGLARAEGYFLTPAGRSVVEQALRKLP